MDWAIAPNAISIACGELRARGTRILDLTESNPTRVSLPYPHDEIADALGRAARHPYVPDPRGLLSAREAISAFHGGSVSPDQIILTASTSEAYAFLLRLLLDPGDELVAPTPSYPLFAHLSQLDGAVLRTFALEFHRRWTLEGPAVLRAMSRRSRAVALVSPNNPTGSYLTRAEQHSVAGICARSGAALISDEVFDAFPIEPPPERASSAAMRTDVLSFALGGLSKSAGLPQMKLAWICVGGPRNERDEALRALELIADNFLSVGTPVQEALPELLRIGCRVREAILERIRANAATLRLEAASCPALEPLAVEGGWSAVLRVPCLRTDEELALDLLREHQVLVHPGYFFDFDRDGYLVISLLPPEETFTEGVRRVVSGVRASLG
jgi:aspartate/methionine/tyrosine aminotransferase